MGRDGGLWWWTRPWRWLWLSRSCYMVDARDECGGEMMGELLIGRMRGRRYANVKELVAMCKSEVKVEA